MEKKQPEKKIIDGFQAISKTLIKDYLEDKNKYSKIKLSAEVLKKFK